MKIKNKAFTLVELIVVITILAILWTIAFITLQWYTRDARDSKRISEISNIASSIEIELSKDWFIPVPEENIEIKVNGVTVYYQWKAWEEVLNKLRIWSEAKDPKDGSRYTYVSTKDYKRYQIYWILEWWEWFTWGNSLWIFLEGDTWKPINSSASWLELNLSNEQYQVYIDSTNSGTLFWTWWEILKVLWKYFIWDYFSSCKHIKDNNNFIAWIDWQYKIKTFDRKSIEVYCDMSTDWWGWTLVAYNRSNSTSVFDRDFMVKYVNPEKISDRNIRNYLSSINPESFSKNLKTNDAMLISNSYSAVPIIENWNWVWDYDVTDCKWALWHTSRLAWCSNHNWNDNFVSNDKFNIAIYSSLPTSIVPFHSELCWAWRWNCDFEFYLR